MAIFTNGDSAHQSAKPDTSTTIITAGAVIKGEMSLACNIYIDGEFEGKIESQKDVNIGKSGTVHGKLEAARVVVQGIMDGDISADRVEIKALGRVKGTIESAELVIEAKGIFEGNSVLKGSKSNASNISLNQA